MFVEGWENRNKQAVDRDMRDLLGEIESLRTELAKLRFELHNKDKPRIPVEKKGCSL